MKFFPITTESPSTTTKQVTKQITNYQDWNSILPPNPVIKNEKGLQGLFQKINKNKFFQ